MLPEIDPVEIALAVIGVRPIISRAVERVKAAQFEAMDSFPRRVELLATQLCRDELEHVALGEISYSATLKNLSEPYEPGQVQAMAARFPADHHDLAGDFVLKAKSVMTFLLGIYPMQTSVTLAGGMNWRPSELIFRRFVAVLEIIDDPLRTFPLAAAGALLRRQVAALQAVYPTMLAAFRAAVDDAISTEKGKKKSYELAPHAERGANVLLGRPLASPAARALQAAYRQQAQVRSAPPPHPEGGQSSPLAKESLTSAQRSIYPDALRPR